MKIKFLGVLMLCIFMMTIGSTADASNRTWVSGRSGDWNVGTNWTAGIVPSGAADTGIFTSGICEVNSATGVISLAQIQGPKAAQTAGAMTWNIKSGASVTNPVLGATATTVSLSRFAGVSMTVNQSGGNFRIYGNDAGSAGLGELRLNSGSATSAGSTANYNLSGGLLDVEILSRGTSNMTTANFTATGGTLVVRNRITKFGRVTDGNGVAQPGQGFNQGLATLEIGNIGTVSSIYIGGSPDNGEPNGSRTDYDIGAGGVLNIDIASASSFDKIRQYGDLADTAGATLSIDLLGGYTPTDTYFDVWSFTDANAIVSTDPLTPYTKYISGSGAFGVVPAGWTATWVDTNADAATDTLRLYIPEPATIALLSLGLLAVRRKRNKK